MNPVKNWKTTVGGILAALLVVLSVLMPDQVDPETQLAVNTAISQILAGAGVLIAFVVNLIAKDPK